MRHSKLAFTIILFATGLLITWRNARADSPNGEKPVSTSDSAESLDIRLARSQLDLAKLDLRRGMEAYKQIPSRKSAALLERLRLHVQIDEERLAQSLLREDGDPHQVCIRSAEAGVRIAKADLKRKLGRHESMPDAFSKLHVERAQVAVEVAVLTLERARAIDSPGATLKHLQWQIDELRHQVLELQLESFFSARGWAGK